MQSLTEREQARAHLVKEGAKAHMEVIATREAVLQAKVEAAVEIQHVKNAMARQAEEIATLKKELAAA